jgi:hypothetical protein
MALSNMGKEPRREIIEQVFGVVFVVGYLVGDYHLARWFYAPKSFWVDPGDLMLMVCGLFLIPGFYFFLQFTHVAGELVCGWLQAAGIDPRPTQRY